MIRNRSWSCKEVSVNDLVAVAILRNGLQILVSKLGREAHGPIISDFCNA